MTSEFEYDMSGAQDMVSQLNGALTGVGGAPGDGARLLQTETGHLLARIGDELGPQSESKALKSVDSEIKQHLTIKPAYSNLDQDQGYSRTAGFTWLAAGPSSLIGINDEDNQISASGAEVVALYRANQKAGSRGAAYEQVGKRGNQHLMRLNRIRVSRGGMNYLRSSIGKRFGELRACFYRVAVQYVPTRRVPGWVAERFAAVLAKGKSRSSESGMGTPLATIEFIARAPGVASRAGIRTKIQGAMDGTRRILASKLKKIVAGYRYDWETGRVFRDKNDIITRSE